MVIQFDVAWSRLAWSGLGGSRVVWGNLGWSGCAWTDLEVLKLWVSLIILSFLFPWAPQPFLGSYGVEEGI